MAKGYITLPIGFQRVDRMPFRNDEVFDTLEAAQQYAAGTSKLGKIAYPTQVVSVKETGDNFGCYMINADMTLSKIPVGGDGMARLYMIDLSKFINGADSSSIEEAIGGWDDFVEAIGKHVPIGGYNGTYGVSVYTSANISSDKVNLCRYDISESAPVLYYYTLTNASGTLSLSVQTIALARRSDLPTKVSDLENDSDFQTGEQVSASISNAINALGNGLTLKGRVDNEDMLPMEGNKPGDVYLVGPEGADEFTEKVWITSDLELGRWETLGRVSIDLSIYLTKEEADEKYAKKEDGVTAEEREKLSMIETDGDGSKFLSNNGEYKTPPKQISNYSELEGKPSLNGVEINGDKTSEELKINDATVKTTESIEVKLGENGSAGGYKNGDTLAAGTTLNAFIKKMLQKQIPPVYKAPVLSLSGDGTTPVECGTVQTITLTASFTKNDGGAMNSYTLKKGAETLIDGDSSITPYEDENVTIPDGSITYTATASYAKGPVKNDNLSNPYPTGQVQAGTTQQATKVYQGQRYCFWEASASDIPVTNSANIRALGGKGYRTNNFAVGVPIAAGTTSVVMAYPASYGDITSIIQKATGYDIKDSFVKTTVDVEGANGYSAISYNVYKYNSEPLGADTFTFVLNISLNLNDILLKTRQTLTPEEQNTVKSNLDLDMVAYFEGLSNMV